MGRGDDKTARDENKQNFNEGTQQDAEAAKAQAANRAAIVSKVNDIFTKNPWMDPSYQENLRGIASSAASGTQKTADAKMKDFAARTGTNSANFADAAEEGARSGERSMHDVLSAAAVADKDKYEQEKEFGINTLGSLDQSYSGDRSRALGYRTNSAGNMTTMAGQGSWYDNMINAGIGAAGAVGAAAVKPAPCWIAEAIYGVDDARTLLMRRWLNGDFKQTFIGALVVRLYMRFGVRVAAQVRQSRLLRASFKLLFDRGLATAVREVNLAA